MINDQHHLYLINIKNITEQKKTKVKRFCRKEKKNIRIFDFKCYNATGQKNSRGFVKFAQLYRTIATAIWRWEKLMIPLVYQSNVRCLLGEGACALDIANQIKVHTFCDWRITIKIKRESPYHSSKNGEKKGNSEIAANLFVAIAMPRRSLINPIKAHFTASVRNIESGVDSKLIKTYSTINIIMTPLHIGVQEWWLSSSTFHQYNIARTITMRSKIGPMTLVQAPYEKNFTWWDSESIKVWNFFKNRF